MFEYLFSLAEKNSIYILTLYLLINTFISNDPFVLLLNISMIILIFAKWITNINVCTVGFLECRIRNVSRKESYVYRILDNVVSINKKKIRYFYYTLFATLLIINIRKFYKIGFNIFNYKDYIEYINKNNVNQNE